MAKSVESKVPAANKLFRVTLVAGVCFGAIVLACSLTLAITAYSSVRAIELKLRQSASGAGRYERSNIALQGSSIPITTIDMQNKITELSKEIEMIKLQLNRTVSEVRSISQIPGAKLLCNYA